MNWLTWLLDAKLQIGSSQILWREIVGNGFGLASAIYGMRRRVAAWPVGMIGNILFFFAVSAYGWWRWRQTRAEHEAGDGGAVAPRWATWPERLGLVVGAAVGIGAFTYVLGMLGSWGPLADAWILTGSILATYGMARGWVEFWLVWIAVDAVGVPLLFQAGYYPSATLYLIYGGFCVMGFVAWLRVEHRLAVPKAPATAEALAGD
jgi:nicotinamide mononucleotide transporter